MSTSLAGIRKTKNARERTCCRQRSLGKELLCPDLAANLAAHHRLLTALVGVHGLTASFVIHLVFGGFSAPGTLAFHLLASVHLGLRNCAPALQYGAT